MMVNKQLVLTIGLILVAIIGFGCVSATEAPDKTISYEDTHTVEQQNINMLKDSNLNNQLNTEKENKPIGNKNQQVNDNTKVSQKDSSDNKTVQNNETNNMDTSTNDMHNTPKLNISGPKTNNSNLNIKGPKITGKNPKISLNQMDKDIYHFAKVFINNPCWDLYDCIDYVRFHSSYKWHEISIIVTKAHNIALHNYHGKEIMSLGWEVTLESVEYRSKNFYGWK